MAAMAVSQCIGTLGRFILLDFRGSTSSMVTPFGVETVERWLSPLVYTEAVIRENKGFPPSSISICLLRKAFLELQGVQCLRFQCRLLAC